MYTSRTHRAQKCNSNRSELHPGVDEDDVNLVQSDVVVLLAIAPFIIMANILPTISVSTQFGEMCHRLQTINGY